MNSWRIAAKAKAWQKKFEDRGIRVATLSCHGNPIHPDPKHAAKDAETFRKTVLLAERSTSKSSSAFPAVPAALRRTPNPTGLPIVGRPNTPPPHDWQWKEKVVPYWKEAAKFAREHGIHGWPLKCIRISWSTIHALLCRLREAVGEEIGANNDLSHLFWQGCDPVEVIHFLGKQGAIFHAHMKDTAFFRTTSTNTASSISHSKQRILPLASETFRAVGYGHGAEPLEIHHQGLHGHRLRGHPQHRK